MVKSLGQPQDTQRHLVLMATKAANPERHLQRRFLGALPVFPAQREALGHGEERHRYVHQAMSYLPAWRTPEMLKRPKSVITTFPLS